VCGLCGVGVCLWVVCGVGGGLCGCVCVVCVLCGVCVRVSIIARGFFPRRYLDDNTYVDKSKEL
jgi:hypothetical protein